MDHKEAIRQLVEVITKAIVDYPANAAVSAIQGEQTLVLKIRTDRLDLGKILGKQGSMAAAIRKIVIAYSAKNGFRCIVEIEE